MNKNKLIRTGSCLAALIITSSALSAPAAAKITDYGRFSEWDRNRDGFLRRYEFSNHIYDMADKDGDGVLNNQEWADYVRSWYDPFHTKNHDFSFYDSDDDGYIENGEFNTSFYQNGLFDEWDYDSSGFVDPNEWNDGVATREAFVAGQKNGNNGE